MGSKNSSVGASEQGGGNSKIVLQIGLFVCACILFLAGIALSFVEGAGQAAVTFGAGVFCLIFAFLSQFKRFKGLGIEAELWEQKQEEAAKLIETLRALAVVASEQLVNLSARIGRWDSGTTHKELFDLVDRLDTVLSSVGISADERERMKTDFYRYTAIDMTRPIVKKINSAIDRKVVEQRKVVESFGPVVKDIGGHRSAAERLQSTERQKVVWDRVLPLAPNPELYNALSKAIDETDCLTQEERADLRSSLADEMEDLRSWVTRRRLRRPDVWFSETSEA